MTVRTSQATGQPSPAHRRPSTWLAVGLVMLGLVMVGYLLLALALPRTVGISQPDGADLLFSLGTIAAWLSMLLTGGTLAVLRPRNAIGWLLLCCGLSFTAWIFTGEYVARAVDLGWPAPGYRVLDWLMPIFEVLGPLLIAVWIPLLFPDGHLPSPRWRPVAWVIGITMAAGMSLDLLTDVDDEYGRRLPNPTAIGGDAEDLVEAVNGVLTLAFVGFIAIALVSVVIRYRGSRHVVRQQLKWFLGAASLVFVSLMGMTVGWMLGLEPLAVGFYFINGIVIGLVPIAIGIAVLRYRLYEIDRLISRTIGWALVTAVLIGVFVVLVLASTEVIEPLTGGDTLAIAASTLVVAALFAPLRSRVQRAVDRRFDRARYDGERLIGAFGERVRDEVDLEVIRADMLGTVDAAVRPAAVGLWLRAPEGER